MDFAELLEILQGFSLPALALVSGTVIIIMAVKLIPIVTKFFTDMADRNEKQDERQQKMWKHLLDTSMQLAQAQQVEFERRLQVQQSEFEHQLKIQRMDFERELHIETTARETLATEMGQKLQEKDVEVEGLNKKIATLNRDLQEAMRSLGTAQQLIKDLTDYKDQLEARLAGVIKERDELAELVSELSERLDQVEQVQRTGTDQLDASKLKPKEDAGDEKDIEDLAA